MADHQPAETRVNTVTVECRRTGPKQDSYEGAPYRQYVLADIEAWCTELRRLGAPDDLVFRDAEGLVTTVEAGEPEIEP